MGGRGLILAMFLVQAMHVVCTVNFHIRGPGEPIKPYNYRIEIRNGLSPDRSRWVKFRCFGGFNGLNWHDLGKFQLNSGESKVLAFFLRHGFADFQIKCRFLNEVNIRMPRDNLVLFDTGWDYYQMCYAGKGGCKVEINDMGNETPAEMYISIDDNRKIFLGDIPDSSCSITKLFGLVFRTKCKIIRDMMIYHHELIGTPCPHCTALFNGFDI